MPLPTGSKALLQCHKMIALDFTNNAHRNCSGIQIEGEQTEGKNLMLDHTKHRALLRVRKSHSPEIFD